MAVRDGFSLRNLYLYLVCLITLIIVIFSAAQLVRGVVELAYPDPGISRFEFPDQGAELTVEERAEQERLAAQSERRYAVLGMVSSGTTLLIAGPLYVYHWRKIQQERPGPGLAQRTGGPPA